jgi:hypothetical protein
MYKEREREREKEKRRVKTIFGGERKEKNVSNPAKRESYPQPKAA